jgi:murein L,D-transpeptidase YafK
MKTLARIFSALLLLMALGLAALWILPQPAPPLPVPMPLTGTIDRIVIEKAARRMVVYRGAEAVKTYRIALGSAPLGPKLRQGDGRTPEGSFTIDRKNAGSAFHLSLGISYPSKADRARAKAGGYDAGGDIMIHGQPNSLPQDALVPYDWTAGCIAVSNPEIEEIFAAAEVGTKVEITP